MLEGQELTDELFDYIIQAANGTETQNKIHGYKEISISKEGVTL
ncbi:MAG: UxaA family hydrolase [Clostridia bacterium]|nr:UxaA family hydrolase [Clostridia bacterium]